MVKLSGVPASTVWWAKARLKITLGDTGDVSDELTPGTPKTVATAWNVVAFCGSCWGGMTAVPFQPVVTVAVTGANGVPFELGVMVTVTVALGTGLPKASVTLTP